MELPELYRCLSDPVRLRILNLLRAGPLCVCHLQAILRQPQVRVSKQLAHLKRRGLVTSSKAGSWRIYALSEGLPESLRAHLALWERQPAAFPELTGDLEAREAALHAVSGPCPPGRLPSARTGKLPEHATATAL